MGQRIATPGAVYIDRPFEGDGASLYLSAPGEITIRYRNIRVVGRGRRRGRTGWVKGSNGVFDIATASVLKTNRAASVAAPDTFTAGNAFAIPAELWPGAGLTAEFAADVRIFADDVENLIANNSTFTFTIDENGDIVTEIRGTATVIETEQRAGGVVWLRIRYDAAINGVQPNQFRLTRTAGPSSPADTVVTYTPGQFFIEIASPALLDSSPYTFDILAEDTVTETEKTVVSGLSVTADATGPIAPINGEISTK